MRCSISYKFWHTWTIPFHFWNSTDRCSIKKKYFLFYSSLLIYDSFFSLFLFLLSFSASLHLLSSPLFLSFFFFFFFLSPEPPPLPFSCFFFPFFLFCHFLCAFSIFFFSLSLSFSVFFFFPPPKPLPLRSAVTMEFGLAVEFSLADEAVAVEISNSDLPLFFFPSVVDSMWLWLWVSWFFFKLFFLG